MNKSDEINELAKSLSKVQGEIHNVFKDKAGYGYKYADLANILDTIRPLLSKHGLSITQLCGSAGELVSVETVLMHESGQWLSSTIEMAVERGKGMSMAQAVGSVISYARRYSAAAMVGIAQSDNDASLEPITTSTHVAVISAHDKLRDKLKAMNADNANVINSLAAYKCNKLIELPESKFEEFLCLVRMKPDVRVN